MSMFRNLLNSGAQYTKLNYIQPTGSEWINTGLTTMQVNGAEYTISGNYYSWDSLFGVWTYDNTFEMKWQASGSFRFSYYGSTFSVTVPSIANPTKFYFNNGIVKVDNVQKTTYTNRASALSTARQLDLFRGNDNHCHMKLHEFILYGLDNITEVRHFIPVLDKQNVPCLYDLVTEQFFYNQGTGQFLYG